MKKQIRSRRKKVKPRFMKKWANSVCQNEQNQSKAEQTEDEVRGEVGRANRKVKHKY